MLFFNCKNRDQEFNYINFELNYCDLFKSMKKDVRSKSLVLLENKKYYIDTYFDENGVIIFDNIFYLHLNKESNILIDNNTDSFEILNLSDYDGKVIEILDKHLKNKKRLQLFICYDDGINYDNKVKFINPILKYVNRKNDSLSKKIYNKKYNDLQTKEKLKIENEFDAFLYFSSCKSSALNHPR